MLTVDEGATKILRTCADVKIDEKVVLVTDDKKESIAKIFRDSALKLKANAITVIMLPPTTGGQEPPAPVRAAMCEADVVILITSYSLSQTNARIEATKHGARIVNAHGMTEKWLSQGLIETDFIALRDTVRKVADLLTKGNNFKITAPGGTDLIFSGSGREGRGFDGLAHKPGLFRPLCVEANIGPLEGTASGRIVIDGSGPPKIGLIEHPIHCEIRKSKIIDITGGPQAETFSQMLEAFEDHNMYMLAELGIGLNPKAELTGTWITSDESVLGTCHFGFGSNLSQGGTMRAKGHFDCIVKSPTIEIDGVVIMRNGQLVDTVL